MGSNTLTLKKVKDKKAKQDSKPAKPVARTGKVHRVSPSTQLPLVLPQSTEMTTQAQPQTQTETTQEAAAPVDMLAYAQSLVPFKVLTPFASCLVSPDQLQAALEANYNEIYIYANGDFYQHMQLRGGRHIRLKVDGLPTKFRELETHLRQNIPAVREEINFLPAGKIPGAMWDQIVEFFRQVMKLKKADMEAHAWILWSQERGYYISIPKQVVSKASVRYSYDEESLPSDSVIVVDVHSHNTMGAFYSGTDNNDDKDKVYYTGVVGSITDDDYKWVMRFNLREKKMDVHLDDIFELSTPVEIPSGWLDQVEVQTYSPGKGKGGPNQGKSFEGWIANQGNRGQKNEPGRTPQNPAKWSAQSSIQSDGKEGGDTARPFRGFPTADSIDPSSGSLWDDLGDGAFSFGGADWPPQAGVSDYNGQASYDEERQVFQAGKRVASREELDELLRDIPGSTVTDADLERLDQQATTWLESHGYDADGNDMLALASNEIKEMKKTFVSEDSTDDAPVEDGTQNAYEIIDALLPDLQGEDEQLQDICTTAYHLMSDDGQRKLQTNGF